MRQHFFGLLAGALVFIGAPDAVQAAEFKCSSSAASPYPALVPTEHDHRRFAPQASGLAKLFTAYFSTFDDEDDDDGDGRPDLRFNPEFVSYELRGVIPDANGIHREPPISLDAPSSWYTSREMVPMVNSLAGVTIRRLDNSYDGIGSIWNRGHLAMGDHAQRISAEAACNTHHFWNGSPQAADLNQGPWLHLETYTAAAANKFGRVWVVTGPIFDPSTPRLAIGDPAEVKIEIPDAFFKVLIREVLAGIETLAFIFPQPNAMGRLPGAPPNSPLRPLPTATWTKCSTASSTPAKDYDHRRHLVSIAEIEAVTRLRFFIGNPRRAALIAARATQMWPVESRFWDPDFPCREGA